MKKSYHALVPLCTDFVIGWGRRRPVREEMSNCEGRMAEVAKEDNDEVRIPVKCFVVTSCYMCLVEGRRMGALSCMIDCLQQIAPVIDEA